MVKMGQRGMEREEMVKMTFAIKCGALRQNLVGGSTAIRGIKRGEILDGLDFSRLIHARIERPGPGLLWAFGLYCGLA